MTSRRKCRLNWWARRPASGFTEATEVAAALAEAIQTSPGLENRSCSSSAAGNPPRAARRDDANGRRAAWHVDQFQA